jgi:D-alanine-D-alanine ligase
MRVAVLAGGRTAERDVSLRSGRRVMTSLGSLGHDAWIVDPAEVQLVASLREREPELCWLALHGKDGEDGTIQRLLELLGIPFTGSAPFDCEVAFDKVLAKESLRRAGVRTPDWRVVEAAGIRELGAGAALDGALAEVGLPCVVKPARSGSALGVAFVERGADLASAVMSALSFSERALIESRIEGTEVASTLVGNPLEALPLVEVVPKDGLFDYAARYTAGATEYFAPARLDERTAHAVTHESVRAAEALRLRDLTRVDVMVDGGGVPWVLEVNVSPGMTETSLVPMAAHAANLDMRDLCDAVLRAASVRAVS